MLPHFPHGTGITNTTAQPWVASSAVPANENINVRDFLVWIGFTSHNVAVLFRVAAAMTELLVMGKGRAVDHALDTVLDRWDFENSGHWLS